MRMRAVWNGTVVAESDQTIVVEGNHNFPLDAIKKQYFHENERHTICPWKGVTSLVVTQFRGKSGVFGRALPVQTPPSSHQLRKSSSYYDLEVDGDINRSAAWYYAQPSPAAR